MDYFIRLGFRYSCMDTLMLIGLVVFLIDDLPVDMCSLLGVLQSPRAARNSLQLPCRAQRLSIGVQQWLHVR